MDQTKRYTIYYENLKELGEGEVSFTDPIVIYRMIKEGVRLFNPSPYFNYMKNGIECMFPIPQENPYM
ncbi:hypothetical protein D1B31_02035 [Neobacillus notoginsengisoli]|uniref:Uncharacterized protein n=1 Tax=Neobacillus notoginsengisoli TaxID=1578198 RepID=A0A417Z015_9BACI|nr:hypothetical protein [Neobacillus notoginsengisoli]RHW43462.1 hypothetical protein D1B31_02035 [Neobacillus notoginsengisoli]